jgi:hypothetical protein
MTNDPTTHDTHDCWGCVVRAKLRDALAGVDPSTPLELLMDELFHELTLEEVSRLAGETLLAWAEDERRAPRHGRIARLASPRHGVRS